MRALLPHVVPAAVARVQQALPQVPGEGRRVTATHAAAPVRGTSRPGAAPARCTPAHSPARCPQTAVDTRRGQAGYRRIFLDYVDEAGASQRGERDCAVELSVGQLQMQLLVKDQVGSRKWSGCLRVHCITKQPSAEPPRAPLHVMCPCRSCSSCRCSWRRAARPRRSWRRSCS